MSTRQLDEEGKINAEKLNTCFEGWGIPQDFLGPNKMGLITFFVTRIEVVRSSKTSPNREVKIIEQERHLMNNKGLISQVIFVKGGSHYEFRGDHWLVLSLEDAIFSKWQEWQRKGYTPDSENSRWIEEVGKAHSYTKELYKEIRPLFKSDRRAYLAIWEMYRLAGYSFDNRQLKDDPQNKASLVKTWVKR